MSEIRPYQISIGILISSWGKLEMVKGVTQTETGFHVGHTGMHKHDDSIPDKVLYTCQGILLTDEWKRILKVDRVYLPEQLKYVHQVQQWMILMYDTVITDTIDWQMALDAEIIESEVI